MQVLSYCTCSHRPWHQQLALLELCFCCFWAAIPTHANNEIFDILQYMYESWDVYAIIHDLNLRKAAPANLWPRVPRPTAKFKTRALSLQMPCIHLLIAAKVDSTADQENLGVAEAGMGIYLRSESPFEVVR